MRSLASERRAARERALGLLYEADLKGRLVAEILAELPAQAHPYAVAIVNAVSQHQERIDELISRFSRGWSLSRMPALDRAALRMGAAELIARPEVPTAVVLSEVVDLVSRFSTDASGRFVNGMLAALAGELRGEPSPRQEAGAPARSAPRTLDALVVDLDGVIRHWRRPPTAPGAQEAENPLRQAEEELGVPPGALAEAAFEPTRLQRAMDGRLSFEGWCREIGEQLAVRHGADPQAAAAAWASTPWVIDLGVVDLLREVRRGGAPVALLSNASTRLSADLDRAGILGEFDAVVGSADIGVTKPEPGAFLAAARALGVPAQRCLFVDDVAVNVAGAREVGMRAEVFGGVEALRTLLEEVGLL